MRNNNCLARCIFINVCPYGSFGRSMELPPAANPVGREFFVSFCCSYCGGVGLVLLCSGEGRSLQEVDRKPQFLQVGRPVMQDV